jgi:hypothetical protein
MLLGCTKPSPPIVATVCQIRQQPGAFEDERVQLTARVVSDFLHFTVLVDDHCGSTRIGVSFDENQAETIRLLQHIQRNLRSTASVDTSTLVTTVVGTFEVVADPSGPTYVLRDARIVKWHAGTNAPPNSPLQPSATAPRVF